MEWPDADGEAGEALLGRERIDMLHLRSAGEPLNMPLISIPSRRLYMPAECRKIISELLSQLSGCSHGLSMTPFTAGVIAASAAV